MEALVLILSKFLLLLSAPLWLFAAGIVVLIGGLLLDFARRWTGAGRNRTPREEFTAFDGTVRDVAGLVLESFPKLVRKTLPPWIAGLAGVVLLANYIFFEPSMRLMMVVVELFTDTELDFKSASGNFFSGQIRFDDFSAVQHAKKRHWTKKEIGSYDVKAGLVEIKIDMSTLIGGLVALPLLRIERVRGILHTVDRNQKYFWNSGGIEGSLNFQVTELAMNDIDVTLLNRDSDPVVISFNSVAANAFRSNYAIFDMLFRSNVTGKVDGRAIAISTQSVNGQTSTQWRMPELQAVSIRRLVSDQPIGWLSEGVISVNANHRWLPETPPVVETDWRIGARGVSTRKREGVSIAEGIYAAPVRKYIDAKGGNLDLRFPVKMAEMEFENRPMLDVYGLWKPFVASMENTISAGVDEGAAQFRLDLEERKLKIREFEQKPVL